jgi:Tfp pilus assembly protein PilX
MKRKFVISISNYRRTGSALVFVLLVLMVVSMLGMTLLTVMTSHYKMTVVERDYQAVYYIAEAGVRYKVNDIKTEIINTYNNTSTSDAFFNQLETYLSSPTSLNSFDSTFGKNPEASISVSLSENVSAYERKYNISSEGTIANRIRTVETEMLIKWIPKNNLLPEAFIYGNKFSFSGNSVLGSGATIIVNGNLNTSDFNGGSFNGVSDIYINGDLSLTNGGAAIGSITNPGDIYINGDLNLGGGVALNGDIHIAGDLNITNGSINNGNVYVQGNGNLKNGTIPGDIYIAGDTSIKDATLDGNVYIGGNLTLGYTPKGAFKIVYMGSLTHPSSYETTILSRCTLVSAIPPISTFEIPTYAISLKENDWFTDNGYTIGGNLKKKIIPQDTKVLVDDFTASGWQAALPGYPSYVVIVSKGDIVIGNKESLTGVLIAPNGKVEFGGASFSGVVITKDGFYFTSGGSTLTAMKLSDFFSDLSEVPFEISELGGGSSIITSEDLIKNVNPIREK